MKNFFAAVSLFALAVSSGPGLSQETGARKVLISEQTVRLISARAYSNLLRQAYEKGWRYPRRQIESGFNRHFEELKLQLIAQGYTIVSQDAEQDRNLRLSQREL
jgi:hypothetical protein